MTRYMWFTKETAVTPRQRVMRLTEMLNNDTSPEYTIDGVLSESIADLRWMRMASLFEKLFWKYWRSLWLDGSESPNGGSNEELCTKSVCSLVLLNCQSKRRHGRWLDGPDHVHVRDLSAASI